MTELISCNKHHDAQLKQHFTTSVETRYFEEYLTIAWSMQGDAAVAEPTIEGKRKGKKNGKASQDASKEAKSEGLLL